VKDLSDDTSKHPHLETVIADSAYRGFQKHSVRLKVEISEKKAHEKGFVPVRHCWVVERTFSWLNRRRRLARDYEYSPTHQKQ